MRKNFVLSFVISVLLSIFTSCTEITKTPDELLKEQLQGQWFCESYLKYMNFMESGSAYYEHPNDLGEGFVNAYGDFHVKDSLLSISYMYAEKSIIHKYQFEFLDNGNKLLLIDSKSGNLYSYVKIVKDVELSLGATMSIREVFSDFTITDYTTYQSVLLCDKKLKNIYGFLEGVGFIKLQTNQGSMMVRVRVSNDEDFILPDFSELLGLSPDEIVEQLGYSTMVLNEALYYEMNAKLISSVWLSYEGENVIIYTALNLTNYIEKEDVKNYLDSHFTYVGYAPETDLYVWNTQENYTIGYTPKGHKLMYFLK